MADSREFTSLTSYNQGHGGVSRQARLFGLARSEIKVLNTPRLYKI
jgi:hypothetical protein